VATKKATKVASTPKKSPAKRSPTKTVSPPAKYPRNALEKSLRIPKAILEQNAGKPCSLKESANFVGVGVAGPYQVEVSSGIKYGFLERPAQGLITVTDRAKKILRPQDPQDKLDGLRDAVLNAPVISDVYAHYRGENLPDKQFFHNALTDTFGVPSDKVGEFEEIFLESLKSAELISELDGKTRIIDVSRHSDSPNIHSSTLKKLEKSVKVDASDTCFVMMPFAPPLGDYYAKIYKPAIEKPVFVLFEPMQISSEPEKS